MKRSILLVLLLAFVSELALSQGNSLGLESLKAPTAPAATILNIQPTDIAKPKSAKDLESAIFSNFVGENNSIVFPDNYSIEVMPFWLVNRKNYDDINYLDRGKTFLHNLSISVASTKSFIISDTLNTNALGFGARSMIYRKALEPERKNIIKKIYNGRLYSAINIQVSSVLDSLEMAGFSRFENFDEVKSIVVKSLMHKWAIETQDYKYYYSNPSVGTVEEYIKLTFDEIKHKNLKLESIENWEDALDEIKTDYKKSAEKGNLEEQITKFLTNREGWQIEAAGALSLNFPTNELGFSVVPKWGIWLTTTYQGTSSSKFQYLGLIRFLRSDIDFYKKYRIDELANYTNDFDLGFKTVFSINKFSADAEFIYRYQSLLIDKKAENNVLVSTWKSESDYKWTFNFNYQLVQNLILSYSFGRGFDAIVPSIGNLISVASLNFGFGGPKVQFNE